MTNDEILIVATQARRDFERKSIELDYIQNLVEKHLSYIAEGYKDRLTEWIEQTLNSFPASSCELAAAVLLDRLKAGKIVFGRYEHEPLGLRNIRKSHAFWMQTNYGDNEPLIADITADQYGGPPIYVGVLNRPWTTPDWSAIS